MSRSRSDSSGRRPGGPLAERNAQALIAGLLALAAAGDLAARHRARSALVLAATAALVVWTLQDRTHFLGDFALRTGTAAGGADLARLFPQAMPLDMLVHVQLPDWQSRAAALEPATSQRLLGASAPRTRCRTLMFLMNRPPGRPVAWAA